MNSLCRYLLLVSVVGEITHVILGADRHHCITAPLLFEQDRCPLVISSYSVVVVARKPLVLVLLVVLTELRLDQIRERLVSTESDVRTVCIFLLVLEIAKIELKIHKIVVELQHPKLGKLVDGNA